MQKLLGFYIICENRIPFKAVIKREGSSGVKLVGCKSVLTRSGGLSTDRSKAVVPVLLIVAFWFILRGDLFYVLPYFVLVFSVLLGLRLPRLGKRELILVLFVRLFDLHLFGFVCPHPFGVWKGLRLAIVALPRLFSYLLLLFSLFLMNKLIYQQSKASCISEMLTPL